MRASKSCPTWLIFWPYRKSLAKPGKLHHILAEGCHTRQRRLNCTLRASQNPESIGSSWSTQLTQRCYSTHLHEMQQLHEMQTLSTRSWVDTKPIAQGLTRYGDLNCGLSDIDMRHCWQWKISFKTKMILCYRKLLILYCIIKKW